MRTADEINFSVIARYVPSLSAIHKVAPSTYIYTLSHSTGTWEKTNIEGSMFVCELTPSPITGNPRHCIIVLNRKGLENLIIYSAEIQEVEITDEFLLLEFRSKEDLFVPDQGKQVKILGFFLTTNTPGEREAICQLVKSHWEMAMKEKERGEGREGMVENFGDEGYGIDGGAATGEGFVENRAMGRRLSLTELFGPR
jgi:hypothetical protein